MSAKLAITADLHLPIAKAERIAALADEMQAFGPDAVIVAGDIGESHINVERCLQTLRDHIRCPIWVLAGNHDVWAWPPHDSHRLWQDVFPQIVARTGCQYLEGKSFVIGNIGVAGTIAWYDYSAVDPTIHASALQFAQVKYQHNADALRIDWEWADPEFAALVGGPFLAALDQLEADAAVRQSVVVTHVPLVEGQMTRKPGDANWAFSNAYFGNLTLGAKVLARRKVSHIISGHTHVGRDCRIDRPGGKPVEAHVIASEYEAPTWMGLTLP
jgi:3',5'-cyclic AMP phosphodiesterase CpdA